MQTMLVKEVFLKKIFNQRIKKIILIIFVIFLSFSIKSDESKYLNKVSKYLNTLNEFSSTFLQIQNNEISSGLLSIKKNRIRIEYIAPTQLVFVLKKNKAMFFNKDLQEVQYFNPKNTSGQFLFNLFNKEEFLLDAEVITGNNYFYLVKKINIDDIQHTLEVYFEEKPFQFRKIQIINESGITSFTIINPNFNPDLDDKIFSLANPLLKP